MPSSRLFRNASATCLAVAMAAPMSLPAAAQVVFSKRQIVQQLQIVPARPPQRTQIVGTGQLQPANAPTVLYRAPAPQGGQVVFRRAPPPEGGQVVMRRAPQAQTLPIIRAPQPESAGFSEFRAPPPSGGVAQQRAPAADNGSRRAPAPQPVEVASNSERGLDVRPNPRHQPAENYPGGGRIDLEILFDYDSARIDPKSVRQLVELGEALNDQELGTVRFMVAGHTDASGSAAYNTDLSFRRARAVTEFLANFAGVSPGRLVIEGYGESLLKYPDAPESGQNRRVEIINLGESG
jgi:outer membrane protein OmpA-like peptidoglycan-associated protein